MLTALLRGPRLSGRTHVAVRRLLLAVPVVVAATAVRASEPSVDQAMVSTIQSLAVASPYRMSAEARGGKIRYWLRFDADVVPELPETGEQHVERAGDRHVVSICAAACGREAPPTESELERLRAATPWLQSDAAEIRRLGRGTGWRVDRVMRRLVKRVARHLDQGPDFVAYRSAREAYASRRGDCTEFALLLAAAARARGIPTRIVAGVAYASRFVGVPHAFGPHMWVQAWNGSRWVSHDAGLGQFDAGHIALIIGDGSPESLRGAMAMIGSLHIDDAASIVADP